MREKNRLSALQVRVARHRRVEHLGGAVDQRRLDLGEAPADAYDRVLQVQALVDRDLVVARAAGVELARDGADLLLEPALDVRVDVLELRAEGEGPRLQLLPHLSEPAHDLGALGRRQEARPLERAGPGLARGEVVRPEAAVDGQRGREPLRGRIGRLAEAPPPRFHDRSAAMSAMIRRVTSSRVALWPAGPAAANARGTPMRTRRGWRRGT